LNINRVEAKKFKLPDISGQAVADGADEFKIVIVRA